MRRALSVVPTAGKAFMSIRLKLFATPLLVVAGYSSAASPDPLDRVSEAQNVFSFPKPDPAAKDEVFEHDLIMPLGFSRNGRLAYLHKSPRDETENNLTLIVVDLSHDKVVFAKSFVNRDRKLADLDPKVRKEWGATLKTYSIEPQIDIEGRGLPFSHGSDKFDVVIRHLKDDPKQMVSMFEVRLTSVNLGEKVIGRVTLETSDRVGSLHAVTVLLSPHEPRVALILGYYRRSMGMTYSDGANPVVLGARLDTGFKRVPAPTNKK